MSRKDDSINSSNKEKESIGDLISQKMFVPSTGKPKHVANQNLTKIYANQLYLIKILDQAVHDGIYDQHSRHKVAHAVQKFLSHFRAETPSLVGKMREQSQDTNAFMAYHSTMDRQLQKLLSMLEPRYIKSIGSRQKPDLLRLQVCKIKNNCRLLSRL